MIQVAGEKVFHGNIANNGRINKKFKGYEGREIYIVIIEKNPGDIS